jgi:hypothetical protein
MSSFSLWGGLGEAGEACVKCGGKPSTLGAQAPTRGASPIKPLTFICQRGLGDGWERIRYVTYESKYGMCNSSWMGAHRVLKHMGATTVCALGHGWIASISTQV